MSLLEMEQPGSNVMWYCDQDGTKITPVGQGEDRVPNISANVGESSHSDFLDLTFCNAAEEDSGQFPLDTFEMLETSWLHVSREQLISETETLTTENKNLLCEKQGGVEVENNNTKTADRIHQGKSNDEKCSTAAASLCKSASASTFYAEYSDEDSSTTSDEQSERFVRLSEEHKLYIQRMSHNCCHRKCNSADKQQDHHHLFDCLLLVGLTVGTDKTKVPYTLLKYPLDANVPPYTEYLCFPDAQKWTPSSCEQSYSLVLTSKTGQRKFGYCRRVLPEGSLACLPLVYCILTPFRGRGFYHNLLRELESRHGQPDQELLGFISSLYNSRFPEPGQTFQLTPRSSFAEDALDAVIPLLRRPYDLRLEEQDLVEMFNILGITILLKVFGSLLLERKVIFISSSFCKLSSCAEAVQSILYPFSWQHVLISVLPHSLLDICQSPTPYVVGILDDDDNHVLETLYSFEDGIIVNLDEPKVLSKVGDENNILPRALERNLRASLELLVNTTGTAEPSTQNVLISEAFLRLFVDICGHYHCHKTVNTKELFDRESFINGASSNSIRLFLEWFVETSMFTEFIDSRLQNEIDDRFEQRVMERAEEQRKLDRTPATKGKKRVKNFKDRFKSWAGK